MHYAREERDQLRVAAAHDSLTGLPNRVLFLDRLEHTLALSRRRGPGPSVLALDLDGFKQVNDMYGHHAGDVVLIGTAQRLSSCIRESDTCARLGGDEFAILLPYSGTDGSARVVAAIERAFVAPFTIRGRAFRFTRASAARSRRPMATAAPSFYASLTSGCTETSRRDPAAFPAPHRGRSICSWTAESHFSR